MLNSFQQNADYLIGDKTDIESLKTKTSASILVISDSHGNPNVLKEILTKHKNCDLLCFCGDGINDLATSIEENELLPEKDKFLPSVIACVQGNGDYNSVQLYTDEVKYLRLPKSQIIDIANKRIFLTHGHEYEVYYTKDFLLSKSIEINADIVIFGHTHIPYSSIKQNKYFFNPGSCERPRGESEKSYGIITIENQSINSSFFRITE
ncbi:MAG: metallophosphoesterase [Treponema sp.]|nr:metallophosphoesterase [Treponema sp.]MBP3607531.1 metallophosphoesterase [Treponema sp.]